MKQHSMQPIDAVPPATEWSFHMSMLRVMATHPSPCLDVLVLFIHLVALEVRVVN